eukprot:scaffold1118_cov127-Isochrysis_galbana.AAC.2
MSISAYASDLSAASLSHSCEITQSNPSPQSGMVQPVVNEMFMFATVHAAGSSLLGLFTSCATFDSTSLKPNLAPSVTRPSFDSAGTRRPVWSVHGDTRVPQLPLRARQVSPFHADGRYA